MKLGVTGAGALALACAVLAGCGGSTAHAPVGDHAASSSGAPAPRRAGNAPAAPPPRLPPAPPPGSLPQTQQRPSGLSSVERAALWQGIATGSLGPARPAFFPEGAYKQVKAVADPGADYQDRLVHDYVLDLSAAHALLGAGAGGARLIGVNVPGEYAHWVDPGVCANRVGYWEVPNSRVVYSEGGQVHSLGIASMISWRGVWYVVHFGAVLRTGDQGLVDDPGSGSGSPTPSSTC